jgi:hypothetical protein
LKLQDQINDAIAAHGMWKARLNSAIDSGASEFAPEKVCTDNQCDFGRWLYSPTFTAADKAGAHYETVRKAHAEFHKVAADVLRLALAGSKDEARRLIGMGSRFGTLSASLTAAMMAWKKQMSA